MSEGHKLGVLLVLPLMHVHRFLSRNEEILEIFVLIFNVGKENF